MKPQRQSTSRKTRKLKTGCRYAGGFNDDVSRVCDVTDIEDYTGLFECFDDENKKYFYLVREDKELRRMKRRHFYENLGLE